jgi:hypothetical protein
VLRPHAGLDAVVAEGSVVSLGPVARPLAMLCARSGDEAAADELATAADRRMRDGGVRLWLRAGGRWSPSGGGLVV